MDWRPSVTVEFYGIPRQRAGRAQLVVQGFCMADVLHAIQRDCPGLSDLVEPDGRLSPHYLLCVDGSGFVADFGHPLGPDAKVLLLSADAGG